MDTDTILARAALRLDAREIPIPAHLSPAARMFLAAAASRCGGLDKNTAHPKRGTSHRIRLQGSSQPCYRTNMLLKRSVIGRALNQERGAACA
jgi:hypothetical protein